MISNHFKACQSQIIYYIPVVNKYKKRSIIFNAKFSEIVILFALDSKATK